MARLFVAVWPSADVVAALRSMARPEVPGVRWTTEEQWHVTLRFLGQADVADAEEALGGLRHRAVTAALRPVGRRLGPSAYVLEVGGLDSLGAAVRAVTAGVGSGPASDLVRPFHGHLTLARVRRGGRAPRGVEMPEAEWPVGEVTLVESHLHPDGSRYEVLNRYPLVG